MTPIRVRLSANAYAHIMAQIPVEHRWVDDDLALVLFTPDGQRVLIVLDAGLIDTPVIVGTV